MEVSINVCPARAGAPFYIALNPKLTLAGEAVGWNKLKIWERLHLFGTWYTQTFPARFDQGA